MSGDAVDLKRDIIATFASSCRNGRPDIAARCIRLYLRVLAKDWRMRALRIVARLLLGGGTVPGPATDPGPDTPSAAIRDAALARDWPRVRELIGDWLDMQRCRLGLWRVRCNTRLTVARIRLEMRCKAWRRR